MTACKLMPIVGALALAFAIGPAEAAPAAPATSALERRPRAERRYPGTVGVSSRHGHRRGWGAAPVARTGRRRLIGTIIANEAYRPRRGYYYDDYAYDGPYYYPSNYSGDPRAICAQNFRSFEWRTGLYTTYSRREAALPLPAVGRGQPSF